MSAFWARFGFVAAIGCGGATGSSPAPVPRDAPQQAEPESTEPLVHVAMISDMSSIAPGQEFTVGVRLDIEPTWHIYWLNPGDAGLPTEVTFTAPAGFEVGDVRYPGPIRFDDPGDIVSYGYEELTVLSAPITAPQTLAAGKKVQLDANTSWLACREACIRGSARSQLLLSVAGPDAPSAPAHESMWSAHIESIPALLSELPGASHSWDNNTLSIEVPAAERVEYFPSPEEQPVISGQAAIPSEEGVSLRISYREAGGAAPVGRSTGVVRVVTADRSRYFQLDIQWPKES